MAGFFSIFYTAISQTFEPDIYRAIADDKKMKLIKILLLIVTLNAVPNLIFIVFAPAIIGLLTYDRYIGSTSFAQILALKNITVSIYYVAITVIIGYGFTKADLLIRLIGATACVIMFKVLINKYSFYGAAWGQVLSFVILGLLSMSFIWIGNLKSQKKVEV